MPRLSSLPRLLTYAIRQLYWGVKGKAYPIAPIEDLAWFASPDKKLRTLKLDEIFPDIIKHVVTLERSFPRSLGSLKVDELAAVAMICQHIQPKHVFEFGTFNGRTTLNIALNTPEDATIFTLDIPTPGTAELRTDSKDAGFVLGESAAGTFFKGHAAERKIRQIWCDSAKFDESPCKGAMDLVFVDGSHTYEYVKNDTEKAVNMLKRNGVILWHDYTVWYPGVPRVLHSLNRRVVHIADTHLAVAY